MSLECASIIVLLIDDLSVVLSKWKVEPCSFCIMSKEYLVELTKNGTHKIMYIHDHIRGHILEQTIYFLNFNSNKQ